MQYERNYLNAAGRIAQVALYLVTAAAANAAFVRSEIVRRSLLGKGGVQVEHERIGVPP